MMADDDSLEHRKSQPPPRPNHKRAAVKIVIVGALITLAIVLLAGFINSQVVEEAKQTLTMWFIIALVIIINLVSFVCGAVLFAAYRWIRRDLKPARDD